MIGPYELGDVVGSTNHTVTYRATRDGGLHSVLIKTLTPGATPSRELWRALEREAEDLRHLAHPQLAMVVEVLREEGSIAVVLTDLGGHRLDAVLDRVERLRPDAAMAVGVEICRALTVLHQHDHVHGALGPACIELTEHGMVRVHDGCARPPPGTELAAPEHLSPEQIVGDAADAQSDVFLFGMLLYRLLAGRPPFSDDGGGVSQRIRHEPPPSLSRLVPDLPAGLEKVVVTCLAKRPTDRYGDLASVSAHLLHILRARTLSPIERLVVAALAEAGLADEPPPLADRDHPRGVAAPRHWASNIVLPGALGVAAVTSGLLIWQATADLPPPPAYGPRGIVRRPALLRVLAHPWAEVHVDGRLVEVTPVAAAIELAPGKHVVVFKHPSAPDEERTIEIIAGQTILLDVTMKVERPPDAGRSPDAGPDADDSP